MNKNRFRKSSVILFSFLFLISSCKAQHYYLFVGTYTNTDSKGIYVYDFDAKTGTVSWVSNTDSVTNPSFLTMSSDHKYLYAVNETNGDNPGRVSAYSFDKKNGTLHFLNTTFSGGDDPCYLELTSDNKWLAVANYTSGTATIFPVKADGTVQPFAQIIYDSIYRNDPDTKPHVHETVFSPDQKYILMPDLGLDEIITYRFDNAITPPIIMSTATFTKSEKGSGPRHIVFSKDKKYVYLIHELIGTVTAYSYNDGKLDKIQDLPAFPEGFNGKKDGAEIFLSPDGKFLYTSLRGDLNSIVIFSVDKKTGQLTIKGSESSFGKGPRYFMIDPTGNFLLAANQDSRNIVIFKRDKETGLLTKTGKEISVPRPVYLQMIPQ